MPQDYRISTITYTGSLNVDISLDVLYERLSLEDPNILYIEYGKRNFDNSCCRSKIKKTITMGTKSKRFDNQVTLLYSKQDENIYANCKIFKNGNVQMTGIKSMEQGHHMLTVLLGIVQNIYSQHPTVFPTADRNKPHISDIKVRLINSDFKVGFDLRRDTFFKVFHEQYPNHPCSYEPCIYPGVKIQYFYNTANTHKDGICHCTSGRCIVGKSCGTGDGLCKKVTIAVFQSGSVIITGGQTIDQVDEAYNFIRPILIANRDKIEKHEIQETTATDTTTSSQKIMLQRSAILYPPGFTPKTA